MAGNETGTKVFYKSKTLWFNVALAAFTALSARMDLLQSYLSDGGYLAVMMLVAAVNVYLRTVTTQGVKR